MTPEEVFTLFRSQMTDTEEPYLWSDDEVWQFIDEAEREFTRLTLGISDATSEVCAVPVTTGEMYADLHHSILTIRHAQRASDSREVKVVNFQDISSGLYTDDYGYPRAFRLDGTTGAINFLVIGMERDKGRLVSVPVEDDTLNLIVYRMPLNSITDASEAFEIGSEHHFYLLHWMKHLAYMKEDAECYDRTKSGTHASAFQAYCAKAKAEQERYKHKVRVVQYGGL